MFKELKETFMDNPLDFIAGIVAMLIFILSFSLLLHIDEVWRIANGWGM